MSNPCKNESLLSALLDGELSEADTLALRRHLQSCEACAQQLAEMAAADEAVHEMETLEPSADFERSFWRKVARWEKRQEARGWTRFLRPTWRPALAAGVVAGLVAGVFILAGPGQGISPDDRFVAENMEFLNDYELIHNLEILENWEALEAMKERS